MARLNIESAFLTHPTVSGRPFARIGTDGVVRFISPLIKCGGNVILSGSGSENMTGWKLGFFQLQFIETNYALYRGRTVADGSGRLSWSHSTLCRDTDEMDADLWYDPQTLTAGASRGVFCATTLPATGNLTMATGFGDAPEQPFDAKIRNRHADNFLYHADIAFHFCTMLVAEDPQHHFTFLKHFYWNVRWEAHFSVDAAGHLHSSHIDHFDINVQRQVHSGVPNDHRFAGRVLSRHLPVSNEMAARPPHRHLSNNWSLA